MGCGRGAGIAREAAVGPRSLCCTAHTGQGQPCLSWRSLGPGLLGGAWASPPCATRPLPDGDPGARRHLCGGGLVLCSPTPLFPLLLQPLGQEKAWCSQPIQPGGFANPFE